MGLQGKSTVTKCGEYKHEAYNHKGGRRSTSRVLDRN